MQGFPLPKLKHKSAKLEARKAELTEQLPNAPAPPALLHPNMAMLFAQRIGQLSEHHARRGWPRPIHPCAVI